MGRNSEKHGGELPQAVVDDLLAQRAEIETVEFKKE